MNKNFLTAVCGGLLLVGSACADTIIAPGTQNQAPDNFTGDPLSGLTLVASTSGPFNSISYTGTYLSAVYSGKQNNSAISCPANNCLTFVYQVDDQTANMATVGPPPTFYQGVITNLTASSFAGFTTDVGYTTALPGTQPTTATTGFTTGFAAGSFVAPTTVDRSIAPGTVVEWDFNTNVFPPGYSDILVVETNAVSYTNGLFSGLGAATTTVVAFGPASLTSTGTPEPSTMILFGSALVGLGLMRKKIRS